MNVDALLKKANFEHCGPMHGVVYVHPTTLEIKEAKQARPWWAVRPKVAIPREQTPAAYLQFFVTPDEAVTPPDPVPLPSDADVIPLGTVTTPVAAEADEVENAPNPRRTRKPKDEAAEGETTEPKAKRTRRKKIDETPES